ncbi:ricin-type beta-trefoil lectin domain protein [Kitasatospora sp. NPDC088346]|uniref:ricin-type beta-trefoil lectin domain protein n=1 Tax=Kitasatospora sp. NPDC088346 TaxID=3364073 RepID=UPI00382F00C2
MSIWTSLEPKSATVEAGGRTSVTLDLRNTGDVVEEYRIAVVGDPAPWAVVEPQTLQLYPGTNGRVTLTFNPPRGPEAEAGPHRYGVHVVPVERPETVEVPEGLLTIAPFTEVTGEILPVSSRGRLRGHAVLAVDNLGNVPITATVQGQRTSSRLRYDIKPANLRIAPGRAAAVTVRIRPPRTLWTGRPVTHAYGLTLERTGAPPQISEGRYEQPVVLSPWVVRSATVVAAATAVAAGLWFAAAPKVVSLAHPYSAAAGTPGQVGLAGALPSAAGPTPVGGEGAPLLLAPPSSATGAAAAGEAPISLVPPGAPLSTGAPTAPVAAAQMPVTAMPSAARAAGAPAASPPPAAAQPIPAESKAGAPAPAPSAQVPAQPSPTPLLPGRIRNVRDGMVVTAAGGGSLSNGIALVGQAYAGPDQSQNWTHFNDYYDNRYFTLTNQLVPGGDFVMDEDVPSHHVQIWKYGGGGNQWWWLDSWTTGSVYVRNRQTGDCLTDNGPGAGLTAVGCQPGNQAQLWTIT